MDFGNVFGEITPLLLVGIVASLVQLFKSTFPLKVWQVWVIAFGLSGLFVGGGTMLLGDNGISPEGAFIALVYTTTGFLSAIGIHNVSSRVYGKRLGEDAG